MLQVTVRAVQVPGCHLTALKPMAATVQKAYLLFGSTHDG